ncbi:MAG: hypothetical protein CVT49_00250 [candidate division Zixibacteria bacterium HGW-Zixibacteria-1]|nr:MAG: hypothetical protein CVT49_00250 [candidate division Zixibacteria bacterium HGW-Zixibacteria-1]
MDRKRLKETIQISFVRQYQRCQTQAPGKITDKISWVIYLIVVLRPDMAGVCSDSRRIFKELHYYVRQKWHYCQALLSVRSKNSGPNQNIYYSMSQYSNRDFFDAI